MGRIELEIDCLIQEYSLSGSSLIGRDERCDIVIPVSVVPAFWLEIRWRDHYWMWRTLGAIEGTTVGSGRQLEAGWRVLGKCEPGKSRRIRCGSEVTLRLVCDGAPTRFGRVIGGAAELTSQAIDEVLNDKRSKAISRARVLGSLESASPVLVYLPEMPDSTESVGVNLADPECTVDIDITNLRATITLRNLETIVTGESVRVLGAYARARLQDAVPEGGWLTRLEAFALWRELGGREDSPPERIGWEKGKLRERLEKAGAANVSSLFENRRSEGIITSRLRIGPGRIFGDEF